MSMYWILFIGIAIISYIVQASLQSKFKKYSKMPLSNGMTGKEVAEKMLHDNGIYDVRVTSTPGLGTRKKAKYLIIQYLAFSFA